MYQKLIDDLRLTAEAGQTSYIIKEKKRRKKIGFAINLDKAPAVPIHLIINITSLFLEKFGTTNKKPNKKRTLMRKK